MRVSADTFLSTRQPKQDCLTKHCVTNHILAFSVIRFTCVSSLSLLDVLLNPANANSRRRRATSAITRGVRGFRGRVHGLTFWLKRSPRWLCSANLQRWSALKPNLQRRFQISTLNICNVLQQRAAWRRRGASLNHIKKGRGNATPVLNLRYPASLCTFRA